MTSNGSSEELKAIPSLKSLIDCQKLQSIASTEVARTGDEDEALVNGTNRDETISDVSSDGQSK